MRRLARTRLTVALISSNAAPSGSTSLFLKRVSAQLRNFSGMNPEITVPALIEALTSTLAALDEPNISSPSPCFDRPTEVLTTLKAFLDVAREMTIIAPAAMRMSGEVEAGPSSADIIWPEASPPPLAVKSLNASSPARGTPMKFTRSLPANAIANANVPSRTSTLKTLTFSRYSMWDRIPVTIAQQRQMSHPCDCIHPRVSGLMKATFLRPLMSMNHMRAVAASPPKMPIFHFSPGPL